MQAEVSWSLTTMTWTLLIAMLSLYSFVLVTFAVGPQARKIINARQERAARVVFFINLVWLTDQTYEFFQCLTIALSRTFLIAATIFSPLSRVCSSVHNSPID